MSKSLGNVIDPIDTIKEFGTDALRFSIALGTPGQVFLNRVYMFFHLWHIHYALLMHPLELIRTLTCPLRDW